MFSRSYFKEFSDVYAKFQFEMSRVIDGTDTRVPMWLCLVLYVDPSILLCDVTLGVVHNLVQDKKRVAPLTLARGFKHCGDRVILVDL